MAAVPPHAPANFEGGGGRRGGRLGRPGVTRPRINPNLNPKRVARTARCRGVARTTRRERCGCVRGRRAVLRANALSDALVRRCHAIRRATLVRTASRWAALSAPTTTEAARIIVPWPSGARPRASQHIRPLKSSTSSHRAFLIFFPLSEPFQRPRLSLSSSTSIHLVLAWRSPSRLLTASSSARLAARAVPPCWTAPSPTRTRRARSASSPSTPTTATFTRAHAAIRHVSPNPVYTHTAPRPARATIASTPHLTRSPQPLASRARTHTHTRTSPARTRHADLHVLLPQAGGKRAVSVPGMSETVRQGQRSLRRALAGRVRGCRDRACVNPAPPSPYKGMAHLRRIRLGRANRLAAAQRPSRERRERKDLLDASRRRQLENVRVVRSNVVYVTGLPTRLCDEKVRGRRGGGARREHGAPATQRWRCRDSRAPHGSDAGGAARACLEPQGVLWPVGRDYPRGRCAECPVQTQGRRRVLALCTRQ